MATTNPILLIIESDILTAAGQPLLTFLAAFATAAGDPVKLAAAAEQLKGSLVGALPGLEATLAQQIAAALAAKLTAAITAATAAKPA